MRHYPQSFTQETIPAALPVAPAAFARWLAAGTALTVLLIVTMAGRSAYESNLQHRELVLARTQNVARVLERYVGGVIAKADVALQSILFDYETRLSRGDAETDAARAVAPLLARHQVLLPEINSLRIVTAEGIVQDRDDERDDVSIADRDHFRRVRDETNAGLVISEPVFGRVDGKWIFLLMRRINRPDGSFGGAVAAGVTSEHFRDTFGALDLGTGSVISLRTTGLRLFARHPVPAGSTGAIGTDRVSTGLRQALRGNPDAGHYVASEPEGMERINAYRRITGYPFYIVVGISTASLRSIARRDALEFGALGALGVLVTLTLSWLLYREWRRRESALAVVARESARSLLLLRNASDGIHILDRAGRPVEVSDSFCAMLGRTRAEVMGLGCGDWDADHSPGELENRLDRLMNTPGNTVFETRLRHAGGGIIEVEINATAVVYDDRPALFCSARDITARKKAELELQRVNTALENMAVRDALTGLFNRRYLDETVVRELAAADRGSYPVSFVMMDIDHFKRINDTYGHKAGDRVLEVAGGLMRESTRGGDIACRYGGEEFLLVMPRASTAAALQRVEQLRAAVENLHLVWEGRALRITLSAGVATYPDDGATADAVIACADSAMYAAKAAGRNLIRAATVQH